MSELDPMRLDLPASNAALGELGSYLDAIVMRVEGIADPEITSYNIQLAATEIFTNIVEHAYAGTDGGRVAIAVELLSARRRLVIELCDAGRHFDREAVPIPDLDEAQVHGYGLFLVEQLMDDVDYQPLPSGNCWRLTKYL